MSCTQCLDLHEYDLPYTFTTLLADKETAEVRTILLSGRQLTLILSAQSCKGIEITNEVLVGMPYVQVAGVFCVLCLIGKGSSLSVLVFSALRVFALWDRNTPLAGLVFLLSFAPVGADLASTTLIRINLLLTGILVHMDPQYLWLRPSFGM